MQVYTAAELFDAFAHRAPKVAVHLGNGQYASLEDVLSDIQARLKKLEEAWNLQNEQKKEEPK